MGKTRREKKKERCGIRIYYTMWKDKGEREGGERIDTGGRKEETSGSVKRKECQEGGQRRGSGQL